MTECHDTAEVNKHLSENRYDLLFADTECPLNDCISKILTLLESRPSLRVVLLSSSPLVHDNHGHGVVCFTILHKPIELKQLDEIVFF